MWIIIAILLLIVWAVFLLFLHITFWAIHLILVIAVIAFILHFIFGKKKV